MNKLISRNPILRFKLGRKIKKCGSGDLVNYHGQTYTVSPSGSGIYVKYDPKTKTYDYNKLITSAEVAEALRQELIRLNRLSKLKNSGYNVGYYNKELESNNSKNFGKTNNTPNSYTFGKMGGWNRSIGKGNINDADSIRYLKEMGLEGKTAAEIQEEINRKLGVKSVKVDNMWGDLSRAGLRALYDYWKLTNTPKAETVTKPSADIKSPSALGSTSYDMKDIIAEPTPLLRAELEMFNNTLNLTFKRNSNYNKSGIRNLIRNYGLNAYDFSGALRRALRLYLNGLSDDTSLLTNGLERFIVPYKQGGQLPSRNIVERFKQRNFRLVAQ